MRIKEIRITPIATSDAPLLNSVGVHAPYALRLVTEVISDEGICGVSEIPGGKRNEIALTNVAARLDGHDPWDFNGLSKIIADTNTDTSDMRGENPWDQRIEVHVRSAIEVACYDLLGKSLGLRVSDLLGGTVRTRIDFAGYLFYKYKGAGGVLGTEVDPNASGWSAALQAEALTPDEIVTQAEAMISEFGFRSLKLKAGALHPEVEAETIEALFRRFGSDLPLRIDPNGVWSVETALRYGHRLKDQLQYLEDPVRGQEAMAKVSRELGIPLATNMCTTSFEDLPSAIELGSEDVILCDHHFWGGFKPCLELGAVCRTFGRGLSMHSNSHLGVSLMAMAHLAAAMPEITYALDTHYPWQEDEIVSGGNIKFDSGAIVLPDRPGLGIEIDQRELKRLHENYLRCSFSERDDEAEMQKIDPNFRALLTKY